MLKSISVWALKDHDSRPPQSLFEEVRGHGFDGIELAIGETGPLTPASTEEGCRALVEGAEACGLQVSSLASGMQWRHPLTADDPEARREAVEIVDKSLRAASHLGVDVLLVVPGMLAPIGARGQEHVPYDVAMERMREGIGRLVPTAEQVGVTIGIENVWNKVLLSPVEMRDFIDGFGSPRVGAYFDVGNVILFGYAEDWISILGERVACVHFKDYQRAAGTSKGFCELLEGDVNFPAVMEALREVGYDGPCVAEFFGLEADALGRLSSAMDRILAM